VGERRPYPDNTIDTTTLRRNEALLSPVLIFYRWRTRSRDFPRMNSMFDIFHPEQRHRRNLDGGREDNRRGTHLFRPVLHYLTTDGRVPSIVRHQIIRTTCTPEKIRGIGNTRRETRYLGCGGVHPPPFVHRALPSRRYTHTWSPEGVLRVTLYWARTLRRPETTALAGAETRRANIFLIELRETEVGTLGMLARLH